jgi:hypothetical protein
MPVLGATGRAAPASVTSTDLGHHDVQPISAETTQTDTCHSGVWVGANPVLCTAEDVCHPAGICDPLTGGCNLRLCQ